MMFAAFSAFFCLGYVLGVYHLNRHLKAKQNEGLVVYRSKLHKHRFKRGVV